MEKIILFIKKTLAIIFSFFIGIFCKKTNSTTKKNKEYNNTNNKVKNNKSKQFVLREEDETKTNTNLEFNNKVLYNLENDLRKVEYLKHSIYKLEEEINNCTDLETLYILENELEKEKYKLDKLVSYYQNININNESVNKIKEINKQCVESIKRQQKLIRKEVEKNTVEKIQKQEKILVEKPKAKETSTVENINILDDIVITTIGINQNKEINYKSIKEPTTNKKQGTNKITNKAVKEYKIDKEILKRNLEEETKKRKIIKLGLISIIISKAISLVKNINVEEVLTNNQVIGVDSFILINNQIRKSINMVGIKTKKLTKYKVIKLIGTNPRLEIKAIIINSIKQIGILKAELKKYGVYDEVVNALNYLDELESELESKVQDLENKNTYNRITVR